jgi:deoxycytidylate deaminase
VHKDDLRKATLFVHRVKMQRSESTEWSDGMARPCSGCMAAIAAFGIKRVIYSTEEHGEYYTLNMTAEAV